MVRFPVMLIPPIELLRFKFPATFNVGPVAVVEPALKLPLTFIVVCPNIVNVPFVRVTMVTFFAPDPLNVSVPAVAFDIVPMVRAPVPPTVLAVLLV